MQPFEYQSLVAQAQSAIQNKRLGQAMLICEQLAQERRNDPAVMSIQARIAIERADNESALKLLQQSISLQPKNIVHHVELAAHLTRMGRSAQAISRFEKALGMAPKDAHLTGLYADALERGGENQRARSILEPFINSKSDTPLMAYVWARLQLTERHPQQAVAALERHLDSATPLPASFYITLGQAHEKSGDPAKAFEAYSRASQRAALAFDLDACIQRQRDIQAVFTRQTLAALPRPQHETKSAIFIAGRPRSGTTLIEKILDAHPQAIGIGENQYIANIAENLAFEIGSTRPFPQCVRDLDQDDVNRLSKGYLDAVNAMLRPSPKRSVKGLLSVNKHLFNYEHLGLIAALLPECRVIHIRREPIDNCWSIFTNDMNYAWATDLRTLGFTHALYEKLMAHWKQQLNLPILDVEYEAIIEDQEGQTRRILEFCGLPWDEKCMRYYEESSAAKKESVSAPTLSYSQVRQPIYKSSVNRAAKFEEYLGPLREGIAEGRRMSLK